MTTRIAIPTATPTATRMDADQWVPRNFRNVRWLDRDHNGIPERATFLDRAGRIVQVWLDTTGTDAPTAYSSIRTAGSFE